MGAVLSIALIAAALWAWFSVFWLVPSNLRSLFRHRLWRIRDELADAIRAGEFESPEEPERVLETIECFIESAELITPARMLLMLASARSSTERLERMSDKPLSLRGLPAEDKKLLGAYIVRFNRAVAVQVFTGSPSGWLLTVFAAPVLLILKLFNVGGNDDRDLAHNVQRRTTEASLAVLNVNHAHDVGVPLSTRVG